MTLLVRNIQSIIKFNVTRFEHNVRTLRDILDIGQYDLGILCASNEYIQYLNKAYRNKNQPTDILSFAFNEKSGYWIPEELPTPKFGEEANLGDIVLGIPYIFERCKEENIPLKDALLVLTTHGICHLMGYDHETEEQYQRMYQKELDILHQYNDTMGTNLEPMTKVT